MTAAHAETKSFVLANFYPAAYYGADTCPQGLNPTPDVFFKRDLKILGVPQAQVDAMFDTDYNNQNVKNKTPWVAYAASRGNGHDSVYVHPTTVRDPRMLPAMGRYAFGFNLDGRGAASPSAFEDPLTHEKGVNNNLFRVLGCIAAYKGAAQPQAPLEAEYRWGSARAAMGAWVISISGPDLSKDGDVTVTLQTSIDAVKTQDANAHVQSDMTYRVTARPASRNTVRGRLHNGIITTDVAPLEMQADSYLQPVFEFRRARLRLALRADGGLDGLLGGYAPWYPIYWSHAKVGYVDERGFGVDAPALYHALRREADADPDPVTGQNTAISATYALQGVPAFVASAGSPRQTPESARAIPGPTIAARIRTLWTAEPSVPGAAATARRLRPDQYRRIIADVFGPTIQVEGRFEPDVRDDGLFAVGAGHVGVTATGLEQYDAMARGIAAQVVAEDNRGTLIPCEPRSPEQPDDGCASRFFQKAGPLLYRRPLTDAQLQLAVSLANASALAVKDFYAGLAASLAGLLESPQFLYRQEVAEPDPGHPGAYRLDASSRATQLSFFLWDSGPDARLMAAAQSGHLDTAAGLAAEVDRMLASPRMEAGVRAFFSDMLQFDLFDTLAKDAQIYPKWTVTVAADAQEQTLHDIVDLVLTQQGDYRDLFTSARTQLTPLLGSLYGVPVAPEAEPQVVRFGPGDRHTGIHTQASFVALHSHEGLSSPTLRGKALRELLLCQSVPAPPGNVNFAAAQDTHNPDFHTMRERLTAHRTDPSCAGCHKLMDPMGLALENFDSDAGFRTTENGRELDTRGDLDGMQFSDPAGLGQALHDNPATGPCLVRRLYSYATGRAPARRDMAWVRYLETRFAQSGFRPPALMREIATSANFYRVTAPVSEAVLASTAGTIQEQFK
jgi:hypothetical protein